MKNLFSLKNEILLFLFGVSLGALIGVFIALIQTSLFDCKTGSCFVRDCVSVNEQCEADNISGEYDCCWYDIKEVSFQDYLFGQIIFFGIIGGCGIGVFFGALFVDRYKQRKGINFD